MQFLFYNLIFAILIALILAFNFIIFNRWEASHKSGNNCRDIFFNKKIYYIVLCGVFISTYIFLKVVFVIKIMAGGTTIFEISTLFAFILISTLINGPFWASIIVLIGNTISYFISTGGQFLLIYAAAECLGCTTCWLIISCWLKSLRGMYSNSLILTSLCSVLIISLALLFNYCVIKNNLYLHYSEKKQKFVFFIVSTALGALTLFWLLSTSCFLRAFYIRRYKYKRNLNLELMEGNSKSKSAQNSYFLQQAQIFFNLFLIQALIYIVCSLVCDSLAVRLLFNVKNSLPALLLLRLIMFIPVVSFETCVCFMFLKLLPRSAQKRCLVSYSQIQKLIPS